MRKVSERAQSCPRRSLLSHAQWEQAGGVTPGGLSASLEISRLGDGDVSS